MPPVVAPTASAAARRRPASRPAARQASAAAASAKRSGRERRRAVAGGSAPTATASGTCAALRQRPRYGNSVKGPMPQRPSASPAASAGTSPPSAHTTPSPVITTRRGTRLLGVRPGSHGERGERAGERERQAQRCAAGGRSEQPSGRAARAARPRTVRRSRHGYPNSLLAGRCQAQLDLRPLSDQIPLCQRDRAALLIGPSSEQIDHPRPALPIGLAELVEANCPLEVLPLEVSVAEREQLHARHGHIA